MSSDGLLDAILADPFDDEPRLIFADRCEETNQAERAVFIRDQIQITKLPHTHDGRGCSKCRRTRYSRKIWKACGGEWYADLAALFENEHDDAGVIFRTRRGFLDEMEMDARRFVQYSEAIFKLAPITRVRVSDPFYPDLPDELLEYIPQNRYGWRRTHKQAFLNACVAWGRERAGLPPLGIRLPHQ